MKKSNFLLFLGFLFLSVPSQAFFCLCLSFLSNIFVEIQIETSSKMYTPFLIELN